LNSLQEIEDAYMAVKIQQKQSAMMRPSKNVGGDKDTIKVIRSGGQSQRQYVLVSTSQSMN
jgi:hypothetical protein